MKTTAISTCILLASFLLVAVGGEPADADKAAVRAFLKENTNTGAWDEIRWWPPLEITQDNAKQRKADLEKEIAAVQRKIRPNTTGKSRQALQRRISDLQEQHSRLVVDDFFSTVRKMQTGDGNTAIRLKYRTQNDLGAKVLKDQVFYLKGGEVVRSYEARVSPFGPFN